jgi:beta-glucosidase
VLAHHPETPLGFDAPSVLDGIRERFAAADITFSAGCAVEGDDRSGFAAAVADAEDADVAVVVVGDSAGLFGRGTVGEGNDVSSLDLPGVQRELIAAIASTGTPVVLVVLSGRPYALDWALDGPDAVGAVVQAFFPGEEGGRALARILAGDVSPSGRLPVSLPRSAGAQPYSYLHPLLGGPSEITTANSTPVRPFGFGLSYTSFQYTDLSAPETAPTSGELGVSVTVTNIGKRGATDVVQLYAHTPYRSTTRPVAQLIGFERVALEPGQSAIVTFDVPSGRLAAAGVDLVRRVEPGEVELWVGTASDRAASGSTTLVGEAHDVALSDRRVTRARSTVSPAAQPSPELSATS